MAFRSARLYITRFPERKGKMTVLRRYLLYPTIRAEEIGSDTPRLLAVFFICRRERPQRARQTDAARKLDCNAKKHIFSATSDVLHTEYAVKLCIYEDLTTRFGPCNALSA
jgi:hypothetical protein